jgi:hypothetical protein
MKKCSQCYEEFEDDKIEDNFYKDITIKSGYRAACKVCCNKGRKDWEAKNEEKHLEYRDNYNNTKRKENREAGLYKETDAEYKDTANKLRREKAYYERLGKLAARMHQKLYAKEIDFIIYN